MELAIAPVDTDEIHAANLDSSEVSEGMVLTEAPRVAIEHPGGRVLIDSPGGRILNDGTPTLTEGTHMSERASEGAVS